MVQITSYKYIRGLDVNSNALVATPGKDTVGGARNACSVADNVVLTRQRMIGNRKGFEYFTPTTSAEVFAMFNYSDNLIEHQADNTLWHSTATSGTRTQFSGSYTAPAGYRMDAAKSRGSLFLTSTAGVMKLDAITHQPTTAGITKALDTRVAIANTGTGFLGYGKVGYRITWLRTDANNQQVRSDVSTRVVATNNGTHFVLASLTSSGGIATATTSTAHGFTTGDQITIAGAVQVPYNGIFTITVTGTTTFTYAIVGVTTSPATTSTFLTADRNTNVIVSFTVPWDVATGDSYEIWRTVAKDVSNADPGDECFLVVRTVNVAVGGTTLSVTDIMPDTTLTASTPLYTNASQEGILAGNAKPPYCSAIAEYKDYVLYGNTAVDHQITMNMLAVAGITAATSTITITNGTIARTYKAQTTETVASQNFQLLTGGISNAFNIEMTTRSLCHVINGDPAGLWYGEYTAGINDQPGIFRIWARTPATGVFWLTANSTTTGGQFMPVIPVSGNSCISSNDARPNRLFYSKALQPDAVPILNTIDVGSLDQPIQRILCSRDAAYIIKSDGIYYLSGLLAPFSLVTLDGTCRCIAPATAVTLNNSVYMLSNQGVVKVSLSGVTVVSFDIEPIVMDQLLPLANLASVAFAVAHETDRHYCLWVPTVFSDSVATQCYVFHTFINEWVRWDKPATAGVVMSNNYTLYLASGLENAILRQRKVGDFTDYSDEEIGLTLTGQTNTTLNVTWTNTVFRPVAGMSIHQGVSFLAKVVSITQLTTTTWIFVIDRDSPFTLGAATARMPVVSHVRLSPNPCGEMGISKSIYSVTFLMETNLVTEAQIEVATNEAPFMRSFNIQRAILSGWGISEWGSSWGDLDSAARSIPWQVDLPVPDTSGESVTCGWYHSVSTERFIISQVAVQFDALSEYVTSD